MYLENTIFINKSRNVIQSSLLILGMMVILWMLMYIIVNDYIASLAIFAGVVMFFLNPFVSHHVLFNLKKTTKLYPQQAPGLFEMLRQLSYKADIEEPELYYMANNEMNAFTTYNRGKPVIVVSAGLLSFLNTFELQGVLAHEISHIRNRDVFLLTFAEATRWLISFLAAFGQILFFLMMPFAFWGTTRISLFSIALVFSAPFVSRLLWFGLSRIREYQADIGSAELTGNPRALASALRKISYKPQSLFDFFFKRYHQNKEIKNDLLKTHPHTQSRIDKLESFEQTKYHRHFLE
ncbi:MAG: M48 family metalloprotease [Spirochaetales bacterium]|nr:M48 family metalloprotease [Spirochaetales bacterium]